MEPSWKYGAVTSTLRKLGVLKEAISASCLVTSVSQRRVRTASYDPHGEKQNAL